MQVKGIFMTPNAALKRHNVDTLAEMELQSEAEKAKYL